MYRIAEATAVLHGVGRVNPDCYGGHQGDENEREERGEAFLYCEEQHYAEAKFKCGQGDGCRERNDAGQEVCRSERCGVVFDFILRAEGVDGFHVAREDERQRDDYPAQVGCYVFRSVHSSVCFLTANFITAKTA